MSQADKPRRSRGTRAAGQGAEGFSEVERAAMRERARELKASKDREQGEREVLEKIAELIEPDRSLALRLHELVKECAPELAPRTWYGMPAYARDGKIVCFFQPAQKFKTRYATLGFNDAAHLDEGQMWPTAYALTALGPTEEERIRELLRRAVG
ncbi:iron chaperone [Thermogemmatispora sp.]|uniref:iron chaperone n=1 Tax=Thermogemmatispora sp. TaxID=1968838 RepID=UPI001DA79F44|nr:DUF1801 domain-containing protein [Thermogemmatispora sp.]MBX5450473.1 DUF1801 domain-containing protein [Thermogemmatispora sp.]